MAELEKQLRGLTIRKDRAGPVSRGERRPGSKMANWLADDPTSRLCTTSFPSQNEKQEREEPLLGHREKLGDSTSPLYRYAQVGPKEIESCVDDTSVEVFGNDVPLPIGTFDCKEIHPSVRDNIRKIGYKDVSPVQKYSIPIIGRNRDLIACAQTGSGKTAAFLIPIISHLLSFNGYRRFGENRSLPCLILVPTRELAIQIYEEAIKLSDRTRVKTAKIHGGTKFTSYDYRNMEQATIVIATPGRLIDMLNRNRLDISGLEYLVLDEADRMLDMGFEPDIRHIIEDYGLQPSGKRKTFMFSATIPPEVEKLAGRFLYNHFYLKASAPRSANENIFQRVERIKESERYSTLLEILRVNGDADKIIVFTQKKADVDILERNLKRDKFPDIVTIHGDKDQEERERAIRLFKGGHASILIATSIAARGLDIPSVSLIVISDISADIEDYIHRIGRTGRAGKKGVSITLLSESDRNIAGKLISVLKNAKQPVPSWLESMAVSQGPGRRPQGGSKPRSAVQSRGRRQ